MCFKMSSSITTEVVNFVLRPDPAPADVRRKAIEHVVDGIGLILAGSRTECVRKLAEFVLEKKGSGSSTLLGFDARVHASDAALVNGTAGHADDYDDTQLSTSPDRIYGLLTHPTTPVLAAALASGEVAGCSGQQLLEAFVVGFEVECKLAEAINPEHYRRGFHSTGTIGAFGACAAASRLFGLGEQEVRYALGITASMSSGIRANFGTMTKPLHAGRAASNGVIACLLARKGFTADRNSLDGRWGFMEILGHGVDAEKIVGRLGDPYSLIDPGASIKMYPCGSLAQPSMDALLEIVREENLTASDVREIKLRAGPNILEPLRYANPVDELQAKFSLQFGLASILSRRRAGLREYTREFLESVEMQEAIRKVRTMLDPEIAEMGTEKMRSIVEVELHDGRLLRRVAETARGTPKRPLKDADLYQKFKECASFVLNDSQIDKVYSSIRNIEGISSVARLTALLTP
jgi:2-methylcitrate dehydratase PrpD